MLSGMGTRRQDEAVSEVVRSGNKVAPEDRQRLANVIACKNVIKDQRAPARILCLATDELYKTISS